MAGVDFRAWLVAPALVVCAFGACTLSVDFDEYQGNAGVTSDGAGGVGGEVVLDCETAQDCPTPDASCISALCLNGVCGTIPSPKGTPADTQSADDCLEVVCDGNGEEIPSHADSDHPPNTDCSSFSCTEGILGELREPFGTSCEHADGSSGVCDNEGECNQCNAPSDCAGVIEESFCVTAACVNGECVPNYAPEGTPHPVQTPGDCKIAVCDGNGVVEERDADDPLEDNNACTINGCVAGTPTLATADDGDACGANGSLACLAGVCDGCTQASQCGTDDECIAHACNAGSCSFVATADGTPLASQTAGDCITRVCDGLGGERDQIDDADEPSDGNDCTIDACSMGAPIHPAEPVDTPCNGGAEYCDGNKSCVECNGPSQCPTAPVCSQATCNANTCGVALVPDGTPTTNQTTGDCRTEICEDGSVAYENANGDLPDDGIDCTLDLCSSGTPSHPAASAGSVCAQGGGQVCDGLGGCVDCVNQVHNYCPDELFCEASNRCMPDRDLGDSCSAGEMCTSNQCVTGSCCEEASCGTCRTCATGSCELVRDYTDPHNHCQGQLVCFKGSCCDNSGGNPQPANADGETNAVALPCPKEQEP